MGIKKELVQKDQERNYLYHINQNSSKVWSVVLSKFTLAFSMAPEFYRRVYGKNPIKSFKTHTDVGEHGNFVANSFWQDSKNKNNGY